MRQLEPLVDLVRRVAAYPCATLGGVCDAIARHDTACNIARRRAKDRDDKAAYAGAVDQCGRVLHWRHHGVIGGNVTAEDLEIVRNMAALAG